MAVSSTTGRQVTHGGTVHSVTAFTESATATQSIAVGKRAVTLSGGTATAAHYSLADGNDGDEVFIYMLATGDNRVHLTGTATGALVFTGATDAVKLEWFNSAWKLSINEGATLATAT